MDCHEPAPALLHSLLVAIAAVLLVVPCAPLAAQNAAEQLTPTELYNQGRAAYDAGDWAKAEELFDGFIKIYGSVAETAETARKLKPLLVSARLQQKEYERTLPLLEEVLQDPLLEPVAADEMAFWRGICHLQLEDHDAARAAFGEFYGEKMPYVVRLPVTHHRIHAGRRVEALLLHGMCTMLKGEFAEAAKFFAQQIPGLRTVNREAAGRATVLRLHSLMESGDDDGALQLVKETFPIMDEISQVVVFQTLSLELGARLLDNGRYYEAIACLQRIWPRERLLTTQRRAQALFTSRLEQVRLVPGQEYLAFQYEGLLTRIKREIDIFEKIPNFDSALRLRIAMAYKELERYREAALVLEDMLHHLPADDIVRKASLSLIQCWLQVERWPKAVAAADAYLARFKTADNPDVPMAEFLKATALHADHKAADAELAFAGLSQRHRESDLAPRALFMEGICLLEQDLNQEAMEAFKQLATEHPGHELNEDGFYWSGMALSFEKRHEEARRKIGDYLRRYPTNPRYASDASFRIGFSTFGLADYARATGELRDFIAHHPESQFHEEAKLLLGDALGALGRIEEAIAAYHSVNPRSNPRFAEETWFKIGNIYKVSERFAEMRTHYEKFVAGNPQGNRIAEAVYWISLSHDKEGHRDLAREACWDAIRKHGPEASARGVEDILMALPRLYPGEEGREDLTKRLDALASSDTMAKPVLAMRARWAKAALWKKKDPAASRAWLVAMAPKMDPPNQSPRILADVADALRETGHLAEAGRQYKEMRRWHPRAVEKDRGYYGLGMIALQENQPEEALKAFQRFEQETLGSGLEGEVARMKGEILAGQQKFAEAQVQYERVLEMRTAARQLKARVLLQLGDLQATRKQDLKATAYYERVYLSYGKYPVETASAYWRRGEALQRLGMADKAEEVLRELAEREELRQQPEFPLAEQWLDSRSPNWRLKSILTPATATPAPTAAATTSAGS